MCVCSRETSFAPTRVKIVVEINFNTSRDGGGDNRSTCSPIQGFGYLPSDVCVNKESVRLQMTHLVVDSPKKRFCIELEDVRQLAVFGDTCT